MSKQIDKFKEGSKRLQKAVEGIGKCSEQISRVFSDIKKSFDSLQNVNLKK